MGYLSVFLCTFCYLGLVSGTTLPPFIDDSSVPGVMDTSGQHAEETATTEMPAGTTSSDVKVAFSNIGCVVNSKTYFEGQYLPDIGGVCSACYCLKGKASCEDIKCKIIPVGCKAVKKEGICCPVDYDCEGAETPMASEVGDQLPEDRNILLGVRESILDILGIVPVKAGEEVVLEKEETEKDKIVDEQEMIDNAKLMENKEMVKNEKVIVNKEMVNSEKIMDKKEMIDNEKVIEHKEMIDGEKMMDKKEIIDGEKMMDKKEMVDGEKMMVKKEMVDGEKMMDKKEMINDEKVTENKEMVENEKVTENKEMVDNEKVTENKEMVDNEKVMENKEVIDGEKIMDKKEMIDVEKMKDKNEMINNKKVIENKDIINNQKISQAEEIINSEKTIDDKEIVDNQVRTNRQNRLEGTEANAEKDIVAVIPKIDDIYVITDEINSEPMEEKIDNVTGEKANSPNMNIEVEEKTPLNTKEPNTNENKALTGEQKLNKTDSIVEEDTDTPVVPKIETELHENLKETTTFEEVKTEAPTAVISKVTNVAEDNLENVLESTLLPEYEDEYIYDYILDENYDDSYIDSETPIVTGNKETIAEYDVPKPNEEEFPTYDINVGTSIIAGDNKPVGVGQVIPVDIKIEKMPTTAPPPKEISPVSFLDSILNLFTGSSVPEEPMKDRVSPDIPENDESSSFVLGPLRTPPRHRPSSGSSPTNINRIDDSEAGLRPPPPLPLLKEKVESKPTRNDLTIRRPTVNDKRRPGLLPRPKFPIAQPPSEKVIADSKFTSIPIKPEVVTGFEAVTKDGIKNEVTDKRKNEQKSGNVKEKQPTLPPSLPNLQIIPFVASDALKKKQSGLNPEDFRSTTSRPTTPDGVPPRLRQNIGRRPIIASRPFPVRRPSLPPRKEISSQTIQKDSDRHKNLRKPLPHRPKVNIEKQLIKAPIKNKSPSRSDLPPLFGRPFSHRNRTGTRPPFIPPRRSFRPEKPLHPRTTGIRPERPHPRPSINLKTDRPTKLAPERHTKLAPERPTKLAPERPSKVTPGRPMIHPSTSGIPINKPIQERLPQRPPPFKLKESVKMKEESSLPISTTSTKTTEVDDSEFIFPLEDKSEFLPPNLLLPKPIPTTRPALNDDIINFVLQDKFMIPTDHSSANVLFDRQKPTMKSKIPHKTTTPLPAIPESVKNQLPLGNDPILSAGLFELAGCNVYGRMYEIGQRITELSAKCKECRCTPVGVQCLPMC